MAVWARVRARAMARARVTLSKSREESTCKGKSVSQTEGKSQRTGKSAGKSESKMSYASLPEPLRYRLKTMAGWAEREGGRGRRMGRREGRG